MMLDYKEFAKKCCCNFYCLEYVGIDKVKEKKQI